MFLCNQRPVKYIIFLKLNNQLLQYYLFSIASSSILREQLDAHFPGFGLIVTFAGLFSSGLNFLN